MPKFNFGLFGKKKTAFEKEAEIESARILEETDLLPESSEDGDKLGKKATQGKDSKNSNPNGANTTSSIGAILPDKDDSILVDEEGNIIKAEATGKKTDEALALDIEKEMDKYKADDPGSLNIDDILSEELGSTDVSGSEPPQDSSDTKTKKDLETEKKANSKGVSNKELADESQESTEPYKTIAQNQNISQQNSEDKGQKKKKALLASMSQAIISQKGEKELTKWKQELEKRKEASAGLMNTEAVKETQDKPQSSHTAKKGIVRTYTGDVQSLVQKNKLSVTKIVALESDKRKFEKNKTKRQKESKLFNLAFALFLISLVIFVSSLIIGYVYYKNITTLKPLAESASANLSKSAQSLLNKLLFIEDRVRIDVTDKSRVYILNVLAAARDSSKLSNTVGDVIELELVEKDKASGKYFKKDVKSLMELLYTGVPASFLNNLKANYMIGVHVLKKGRAPFMVFTTKSYHYAYAGMLNWEETMEADLGTFMIPGQNDANVLPVASLGDKFKDLLIKNYNVRVLSSKDGKVKIIYGFVGDDTIVISNNSKTFIELVKRIRINKAY